jgi:hypothetical protein
MPRILAKPARRGIFALVGVCLASVVLALAPAAGAQNYEQETGDLDLTLSFVITIAGDGFVPGSVVYVTITPQNEIEGVDLGTIDVGANGAFSGTITLPDDLPEGAYVVATTGVTPDGATRVLSTGLTLGDAITINPIPTTTTSTTLTEPQAAPSTATPGSTLALPRTDTGEPADWIGLLLVLAVIVSLIGGVVWLLRITDKP